MDRLATWHVSVLRRNSHMEVAFLNSTSDEIGLRGDAIGGGPTHAADINADL